MADFCITAVRYNQDHTHIEYVQAREELPNEIGLARAIPRVFIADLIRLGKASFQTRIKTEDGTYKIGALIHVVDGLYLTTDRNSTKRDNLGNLPEF